MRLVHHSTVTCLLLCSLAAPAGRAVLAARPDLARLAFDALDLERPDMAKVKTAANAEDWDEAAKEWLRVHRDSQSPRWFWSHDDRPAITRMIRAEMPDAYRAVMNEAGEIMRHRFPNSSAAPVVFRVQLPDEFNWADNPTYDPQFVFMLNRHRFWVDLGMAYAFTGDEKYVREWAKQLGGWLSEVPLVMQDESARKSAMWYALDAGIRGKQWTWAWFLFRDSSALTPELHARWTRLWAEHAEFLRRRHAGPGSNWCAMQMEGLLCIALAFPQLKGSDEWREYAVATLVKAQRTQIRPDGVQVEQSPSYHMGCVRWFWEPMRFGELNGVNWPPDYRKRLEQMCEFAMWTIGPDGLIVALSDSDRDDYGQSVMANGAILFNRPDFAALARPTARHVFLHGPAAVRELMRAPKKLPAQLVRHFPDAGYVMMRSGWDERAGYCVFDCGPKGGGHGHFDLLNVEIHGLGKLLIADPGRWLYDDSALRREMLSTPAHNTISLDGQSHGRFERAADGPPPYEIVQLETRDGWTHLHGRHRAYTQMAGPPVCERRIFYDGASTWLVVDSVKAPEPHEVMVNFQFAVEPVVKAAPGVVVAGSPNGRRVLIAFEQDDSLAATIEPGTLSRVYGDKETVSRLRLRRSADRVRIVSLIHAFSGDDVPSASLSSTGHEGFVVRWRLGSSRRELHAGDAGGWTFSRGPDESGR